MNRKNPSADKFIYGRIAARAIIFAVLCAGGLTAGSAVVSCGFHWAAWVGLVPLFAAIRRLTGREALAGGALWGGAAYFAAIIASRTFIPVSFAAYAVYVVLPAVYVYFMASFSRRYWHSSLAMALGWIVVELAVNASGIQPGLITAEHIESPFLRVIADFLGSGFIAFLFAYAGAIVITVVSNLCVYWHSTPTLIPQYSEAGFIHESQTLALFGRRLRPMRPRGPPHTAKIQFI